MDIKETMEVFTAVEAEADAIIASCADGKLGLGDIKHQLPVLAKARAAFDHAGSIAAELKDLDEAEIEQVVAKIASVGSKVMEAAAALAAVLGSSAA